ncbi:unnamed protein product, partial [Acidithrix sp. C25]
VSDLIVWPSSWVVRPLFAGNLSFGAHFISAIEESDGV